jgi:hypothetical protein
MGVSLPIFDHHPHPDLLAGQTVHWTVCQPLEPSRESKFFLTPQALFILRMAFTKDSSAYRRDGVEENASNCRDSYIK